MKGRKTGQLRDVLRELIHGPLGPAEAESLGQGRLLPHAQATETGV